MHYNFKNTVFHSLRFYFFANSADPGKMLQNTIFHQGLHYLKKYPLAVSSLQKLVVSKLINIDEVKRIRKQTN